MAWLLTAILCSLLAELFIRLPLLPAAMKASGVASKAVSVMAAKGVSDHWKEKVMLVYAGRLFRQTMILTGFFVLWAAVLVALVWIFEQVEPSFYAFLTSWIGLGFTLVWSTLFVIARNRLVRRRL